VTLERWRALSRGEQLKRAQRLSGDELEKLAGRIETMFRSEHGGQRGIADLACGEVGHLGPVHGIESGCRGWQSWLPEFSASGLFGHRERNRVPPNPRLQRTPSAPLSRQPLGVSNKC
jgi:hypothetical protein